MSFVYFFGFFLLIFFLYFLRDSFEKSGLVFEKRKKRRNGLKIVFNRRKQTDEENS